MGAAYLAGLAVGYWKNLEEIQQQWKADTVFQPYATEMQRKQWSREWQRAIRAAQTWANDSMNKLIYLLNSCNFDRLPILKLFGFKQLTSSLFSG